MRAPIVLVIGVLVAACAGAATTGGALASGSSPSATAVGAFVRVNQVGYPSADSKRAYLLASVPETGATFARLERLDDGVHRLRRSPTCGRWSTTFPHVYALDFDAVTTPGTYTIAVTGPAPATSPPFRIDAGPAVDAQAIANAAVLLPERARRARVARSAAAAPRPAPPARRDGDDVRDAARTTTTAASPGLAARARQADRRLGRLVGRRRLPEVPADDRVHRRDRC